MRDRGVALPGEVAETVDKYALEAPRTWKPIWRQSAMWS